MPLNESISKEIPSQQRDFYQKLRNRIKGFRGKKYADHKWIELAVLAPDLFHLFVKLSLDKDVPPRHKAQLLIAIAYFTSPINFLTGLIPISA